MPTPDPSSATEFFKASLQQGVLSHGYVLYGKSPQTQYNLCLFLAQVLNCESQEARATFTPCNVCRPCKWISNNAHPSVVTLSPLTYPDVATEGKARKGSIITVGQIRQLLSQLSQHPKPGEERIVIFTHAEAIPALEASVASQQNYPTPSEWQNEKETLRWKPLTSRTFSAQSANAFLKYLEEPTPGIRYFFLTQQPETLLATVVSRCQRIYVPPDTTLLNDDATQKIPHEAPLLGWLRDCMNTSPNGLPAHSSTQAFIQLAEDEQVKPKRLFEALPLLLSRHREALFQQDHMRYLAWQEEAHQALTAMEHYVQPPNALWQMLHTLCEKY
jgi:hypothetical protein